MGRAWGDMYLSIGINRSINELFNLKGHLFFHCRLLNPFTLIKKPVPLFSADRIELRVIRCLQKCLVRALVDYASLIHTTNGQNNDYGRTFDGGFKQKSGDILLS